MTDQHVYDEEEAKRVAAIYTAPSTVDRREWLMEHLDLEPGQSALSIGCGPGYEPEAMAERVGTEGRVFGIDNSEDVLAIGTPKLRVSLVRYLS
jgi:ubiquinone/menaquinone biosynthesis C-methylase UbiE